MADVPLSRIPRQPSMTVRPLGQHDVDNVLALQQLAYAENYLESHESFASKIAAGPSTCFGGWLEGHMVGYLIAVPLEAGAALHLDSTIDKPTQIASAGQIYIHDLAVHPDHRSLGLADVLLVHLSVAASQHNISHFSLVAVQNSTEFWEGRGFALEKGQMPNGYGPEAVLMSRR